MSAAIINEIKTTVNSHAADIEAGGESDEQLAANIATVNQSIADAQAQADQRAADEQARHDDQAVLIAALRTDVDAIMIPDPLFKGEIAAGTYDFTNFPAPTTGNAFIDGGGAVEAGTNFIATGDGSFILLPVGGGASLTYDFTEGDEITVTEDAASFSVAVLNVNEDTGGVAEELSDIRSQLGNWTIGQAEPLVSSNFGGYPSVILEDARTGSFSTMTLAGNSPLINNQRAGY